MKKGTLIKEGKNWKLTNPNMPIMGDFGLTDDLNGKEVEFDNSGGPVKVIIAEGKKYEKKQFMQSNHHKNVGDRQYGQGRNQPSPQNRNFNPSRQEIIVKAAKSPYNFVPLNRKVVPVPQPGEGPMERYTGTINLTIITQTPLFVRGNLENFLLIMSRPIIPGSSLRGMIRNLAEIVSWSKFNTYDNKFLSHRGMAETGSLKKEYDDHFMENEEYKANAGYLFYNAELHAYFIHPAKIFGIKKSIGFDEFTYEKSADGAWTVYSGKMEVSIKGTKELNLEKTKQKHYTIGPKLKDEHPIRVPDEVIDTYRNDETKAKEYDEKKPSKKYYDLLERIENDKRFKEGVPVFYIKNGNVIQSFGHTMHYRIPYLNDIQTHVLPEQEHQKNVIDFPEAIFGCSNDQKNSRDGLASRVFFADATTRETNWRLSTKAFQPKILSSPKPTSFQMYLEQPDGWKTSPKNLKHWNDEQSPLRGHKLYWHRKTSSDSSVPYSWVEDTGKKPTDSHPKPIRPARTGLEFSSAIRFQNLSACELGCLLFAIDLPEGCCHKLGMGKPLGLGSVKIKPVLKLSDLCERYSMLFENNNWYQPLIKGKTIKNFVTDFENYILQNITVAERGVATSLWETPRLNQLKNILDFEPDKHVNGKPVGWLEWTRYMDINKKEFRYRPVLPKPDEVIDPETYDKNI